MAAVICEHHSSPDGYLPSPLILGSAIAARTNQLMMTLIVILPFYDPVRLAEEIAVLDLISKGRATKQCCRAAAQSRLAVPGARRPLSERLGIPLHVGRHRMVVKP